ncbi:MAG: hypothetical protein V3W41_22715 [Planctomycetota bacterium]
MKRNRLCEALVDRALEFHRRRFWLRIAAEDNIGIVSPDSPELMIGSVMGQGREHGLSFFRGVNAASIIFRAIDGDQTEDVVDQLGFSVGPLSRIPPEYRHVLDQARFKGRRETLAPWFISKKPGIRSRGPNRKEQRALLFALNGILLADDKDQLNPVDIRDGRILSFELEGSAFEPIVKPSIRSVLKAEDLEFEDDPSELY